MYYLMIFYFFIFYFPLLQIPQTYIFFLNNLSIIIMKKIPYCNFILFL